MSGVFITFEGGEGAGKSTQIKRLAARLKEQGHKVLITREPGGTKGAEAVRHVILSGAAQPFGTELEAVLFAAARADNVREIIAPALKKGMIVLCDRYMDSSRVYQGASGKVDLTFLSLMERAVTEGAVPDLTFIFDLPAEEGLKRVGKRGEGADRFEREALDAHEVRRQAYLAIASAEPDRCKVIDANRSEDEVAEAVAVHVDQLLSEHALADNDA